MNLRRLSALVALGLGLGHGASAGCTRRHGDDAEPNGAAGSMAGAMAGATAQPMDASNDPGDPGIPYGTLGEGTLSVAGTQVGGIRYTLAVPNRNDRAHLFAVVSPAESRGVSEYYLSLVFEESGWRTGIYEGAVGGRASFELSDGKRYAANGSELDLTLNATSVMAIEKVILLKSRLEMRVPSVTPGEPPLEVVVTSF